MKSLADLFHLRQSSTSSTASTSSSKSFGHPINRRESFSSAERMEDRAGPRKHAPTQSMSSSSAKKAESSGRQRAVSTGVVDAGGGYGNSSPGGMMAGEGDQRRSLGRSTRRGGSTSGAVGMMPLAPPADIHPPFPSAIHKLHAEHHSTSSIPTLPTLPPLPPSEPRRSVQSFASRSIQPSPTETTETTESTSGSSTASAIALRRRSRARSTSISMTMGLNYAPSSSASTSGSTTPLTEYSTIELVLPPQKPAPVGIPLPATPTPMRTLTTPTPSRVDEWTGLSSYASCSTIRLGTTPTASSSREDKDSTPTQRTTSTLLSLNLSPPSDDGRGLSRTKRQLSSVSFWKDGLVNELDGIWVGGGESGVMPGRRGLSERREWGGRDLVTSREGKGGVVVVEDEDGSVKITIPEKDDRSPLMPNSISDISLTNFQFPMPPTHRNVVEPTRSISQVSMDKELPFLPGMSILTTASPEVTNLDLTPRSITQTDSARSSVSSIAPPILSPWLHDRQSSISSLYTSLGFHEVGASGGGRLRSPTWSSTSDSLGTPRTPGGVSFDFVGPDGDMEGEEMVGQGKGMDRLVRLLEGVGQQDMVYEEEGNEEICWGQAF